METGTDQASAAIPHERSQFDVLMEAVVAGDADAARRLIDEYGPHLLRAVRQRLSHKLRSKFDSQDFLQDVWASFFAQLDQDQEFTRPEKLVAFLTAMVRNKVVDAVRMRMTGQKYNVNRECALPDPAVDFRNNLVARDPTPSTQAMSREEWERLVSGQPLVYRRILSMLRDGAGASEIADAIGVSAKTVRRLRDKFLPGGFE